MLSPSSAGPSVVVQTTSKISIRGTDVTPALCMAVASRGSVADEPVAEGVPCEGRDGAAVVDAAEPLGRTAQYPAAHAGVGESRRRGGVAG